MRNLDLKYMAKKAAKTIELDYTPREKWIKNFKNRHKIVSRKVSTFYSKKAYNSRENLNVIIKNFQSKMKSLLPSFSPENVWNADESGFNKEMVLSRTLDYQGVKKVNGIVNSMHSTTHSYTILPLISMAGKLGPTLLVVLQENQQPSKNIQNTMFKAPNLKVCWTKSGKMDKKIFELFIKEICLPNMGPKNLLLLNLKN